MPTRLRAFSIAGRLLSALAARPVRTTLLAAAVLLATAVLAPTPAAADHDCDDRGDNATHEACDPGGQLISTQEQVVFEDLDGAFEYLGFSQPQANELSKINVPIVNPQRFRFATDLNSPPTIDDPWTQIISHGVAEVEFGPDSLIGSGDFDCNVLGNGFRSFCASGPPQPGVTYTGFFTSYGDQIPIDDTGGLFVNLSWPTTTGDLPTWVFQGDFVGDTWQGASYIPSITYGPNPWSLQVSQLQDGVLIDVPDSQVFGLIGGNGSLLFVPTTELMQGGPTWDGFRSGFALHVHDGTFGACQDCASVVTPYPAFPRDGLMLFAENEIFIANGATVEPPPTESPSPTPSPSPSPTSTPGATATGGGTTAGGGAATDGSSGDGPPADDGGELTTVVLIFATIAGIGLVVVGVTVLRGTRTRTPAGATGTTNGPGTGVGDGGGSGIETGTRTRPPISSAPPVPETPSCSCTVSVAIEGPNDIGVCCMKPTLSLNQTEYTSPGADEMKLDPSRIHLDANVEGKTNWDLFDKFYSATITPTCSDGGKALIADATYDWSVVPFDGGFNIVVKVSVPVTCPNAAEHPPATAETTYRVSYHSAPCRIMVLVERVGIREISHVDVQIVCGEYNEIFGYFPVGGNTFVNTIAGAGGQVIRTSAASAAKNRRGWTSGIADQIGSDYAKSHLNKSLNVYFIEPDDCSICEKLRNEWELLAANPGKYWLLTNNCASQAFKTLTTSGAISAGTVSPTTPSGLERHFTNLRSMTDAGDEHPITEATEIR